MMNRIIIELFVNVCKKEGTFDQRKPTGTCGMAADRKKNRISDLFIGRDTEIHRLTCQFGTEETHNNLKISLIQTVIRPADQFTEKDLIALAISRERGFERRAQLKKPLLRNSPRQCTDDRTLA